MHTNSLGNKTQGLWRSFARVPIANDSAGVYDQNEVRIIPSFRVATRFTIKVSSVYGGAIDGLVVPILRTTLLRFVPKCQGGCVAFSNLSLHTGGSAFSGAVAAHPAKSAISPLLNTRGK